MLVESTYCPYCGADSTEIRCFATSDTEEILGCYRCERLYRLIFVDEVRAWDRTLGPEEALRRRRGRARDRRPAAVWVRKRSRPDW